MWLHIFFVLQSLLVKYVTELHYFHNNVLKHSHCLHSFLLCLPPLHPFIPLLQLSSFSLTSYPSNSHSSTKKTWMPLTDGHHPSLCFSTHLLQCMSGRERMDKLTWILCHSQQSLSFFSPGGPPTVFSSAQLSPNIPAVFHRMCRSNICMSFCLVFFCVWMFAWGCPSCLQICQYRNDYCWKGIQKESVGS